MGGSRLAGRGSCLSRNLDPSVLSQPSGMPRMPWVTVQVPLTQTRPGVVADPKSQRAMVLFWSVLKPS